MLGLLVVVLASVVLLVGRAGEFSGGAGPSFVEGWRTDVVPRLAHRPTAVSSWWGGVYTLGTGERVRLYISDEYPVDEAFAARWLAFLQSLVHGSELGEVTIYLGSLALVGRMCGDEALACYAPREEAIVTSGDDVPGQATAQQLLAHEYAHHIATNRSNTPWFAGEWGTKRWASYEGICARQRAGEVFPGDEEDNYALNPGEAFAEVYRVLTDEQLSVPFSWDLVDESFAPDAAAITLVREDVLAPWKPSTRQIRGKLARRGRALTVTFATPLDGTLAFRLALPRGARVKVTSTPVARPTAGVGFFGTICGERRAVVRLKTLAGSGKFVLRLTIP